MKNTLLIIFLVVINLVSFGQQKNVNNYKYVIVPEKFDILKEKDQYQTSSLTKFLLKKNGFTVILDSEVYPEQLKRNSCDGLTVNVLNKSSMFKTKVILELKDCYNKVIYSSKEGTSRLKDYKKSFQEAIRNAHNSMSAIKYEALTEEVLLETKKVKVIDIPIVKTKAEVIKPIVTGISMVKNKIDNIKKDALTPSNILYAQPKENGFQLINLKPEVVFLILKTKIKNVYIIKDKNGLLYKNDLNWIAEFYEKGKLVQKIYQIKF